MTLKKGNTYNLKVPIKFNNVLLNDTDVSKVVFKFGEIQKEFPSESVSYDTDNSLFIVNFTQEDTLKLSDKVEYEVAVKFPSNQVVRSNVKETYSLKTIIEEVI